MKPLDPRLISQSKATRWLILALVALALAALGSTVAIAYYLASFIVGVFIDGDSVADSATQLGVALLFAGVRSLVQYLQESISAGVAQRVKLELRSKALKSLAQEPGANSGSWSYLLGPGLDSLDVYFAKFLPQLIFTALVTPIFVVLLLLVDFPSGLVLVLTIPLIPIFMVLIGLVTRDAQQRQLDALSRLNQHFLEVLRGLTTLKIFNRVQRQSEVLETLSEEHRNKTMKVLRVSFLSGFALELAASLSVALMAVTIGIRLIDGELDLFTGLFVLLIAPEAYLPLRQVGAQFHASQEALEVSNRVLDRIGQPVHSVQNQFQLQPGVTVLTGPSGSGKTTILRSLADQGAYQPQGSAVISGTLRENILMGSNYDAANYQRAKAIAAIEGLDDQLQLSENSPLSGGQLQRVALARAGYRAFTEGLPLVLDEPLSQLDPTLVARIALAIRELANEGYDAVIATHQKELIAIADREVKIGNS